MKAHLEILQTPNFDIDATVNYRRSVINGGETKIEDGIELHQAKNVVSGVNIYYNHNGKIIPVYLDASAIIALATKITELGREKCFIEHE